MSFSNTFLTQKSHDGRSCLFRFSFLLSLCDCSSAIRSQLPSVLLKMLVCLFERESFVVISFLERKSVGIETSEKQNGKNGESLSLDADVFLHWLKQIHLDSRAPKFCDQEYSLGRERRIKRQNVFCFQKCGMLSIDSDKVSLAGWEKEAKK